MEKRKLWQHPWRYRESFLVVLELALLGFIFEVLSRGKGAPQLQWPANAILGMVILVLVLVISWRLRKNPVIKWLSSVPAAISAISFFALVVLLLGFIPQNPSTSNRFLNLLGLTHVKNSWLMMMSGLYFLVALGFVAVRRARPLTRKNMGFLLNHAGLWITIAAAYLGAGDLETLDLRLVEGHRAMNIALNMKTRQVDSLPFQVSLKDFSIEDYNPKLAVFDASSGKIIGEEGKAMQSIEEGLLTTVLDWRVEVLEYEPDAMMDEDGYVPWDSAGSAPAALVRATREGSGQTREGWISCGSFMVMHRHLQLDHTRFLAMTVPEPRKYSSDLVIYDDDTGTTEVRVEVNKPCKHQGWKLYQVSYDESLGKWSRISVIEAVRDPWLPLVYAGIFLLLAGAGYLFWTGNTLKD